MTKVYLVTDGAYSDYRVLGIFSTRARANRAKTLYNAYNDIDVIELDEVPNKPRGLLPYGVRIRYENSDVIGVDRMSVERFDTGWIYFTYHTQHFSFHVWAKNEEHAIKIAAEKRAQVLANGFDVHLGYQSGSF